MKKCLFVFFLLFLFAGCNSSIQEDIPFVRYETVKTEIVSSSDVFYGFIDNELDVELAFGSSGIMNEIYANEGQFYKKGSLLAKLDDKENLLEINSIQFELDDANIKYKRAKSYFERITKLHDVGGISYNDWEEAQTNLKISLNQIHILSDKLNIAKNKEKFSNIFAPYDGYVIKTYKDKMQYVSSGEKVILFQGKGKIEARIFVSDSAVNKIKTGDKILLKAEPFRDKTYFGTVKSIVKSSLENGAFRVTVVLDEFCNELLDGMSVSVIFDSGTEYKIFIPHASVLNDGANTFVFCLIKNDSDTGIVQKRIISTGEINGDKIQIKDGLNSGDFLITAGMNELSDGKKVKF